MSNSCTRYCGRFAPSPTGPLHLGSLLSACASWLDARANGGRWLIRMEDLDPPREAPGARTEILATLTRSGMHSDLPIRVQSERARAYDDALLRLLRSGHAFECRCSRTDLAASGGIHRGPCRASDRRRAPAIRLRVPDAVVSFADRIQGNYAQALAVCVGDVVLKRADGLYAYQLAVVVDDADQGITHVVRGADLLDSTPRQIYLQRCLGLRTPSYAHVPVLLGADGQKLSKQNLAPAIVAGTELHALRRVGRWLGQPDSDADSASAWLAQAAERWRLDAIPRRYGIPIGDDQH